ncbi:transcriptional regulator with XRE-family HTH domain [Aminobacter lissarensis]|uniref:Transcriptional regulator with XRE-family HTH domain n=1 Tax=Aminobacter carboxidus TaxID=376165 RepID=A0A8E1WC77_9HYPH|nr:XRE family transcriptional regulator [Aminobacter lissarensis]MBB6464876.1 transcriptional regulator with XRE-family HTH domain [Aminobacter lissarensis]
MNMHSVNPPEIGPRLQAYRKAQKLTLADLATKSGVSRSMLSEIERGNANPTYGTLWHLTRALDIDLNSLISGASEERGDRIDLQPENLTPTIRSADGSCTLQILSPAGMVPLIEWYLLSFEPQGKLLSDPHGAGTIEHLHCTEGEIVVRSAGNEMRVRAGETARYAGDVPHSLTSVGTSAGPVGARAFLVVTSGEVGSSTKRALIRPK